MLQYWLINALLSNLILNNHIAISYEVVWLEVERHYQGQKLSCFTLLRYWPIRGPVINWILNDIHIASGTILNKIHARKDLIENSPTCSFRSCYIIDNFTALQQSTVCDNKSKLFNNNLKSLFSMLDQSSVHQWQFIQQIR